MNFKKSDGEGVDECELSGYKRLGHVTVSQLFYGLLLTLRLLHWLNGKVADSRM